MNDLIRDYYLGERATALLAMSLGMMLLLSSIVLFRISPRVSVQRGMAYVLLVGGLFFALSGGGYGYVVQQRMHAHEIKARAGNEMREAEVVRMESVLKSSYSGALRMFTTLLCAGLLVACFSKGFPVRQGVAVGLIVFGLVGHTTEALSMRKNRDYLKRVREYQPIEAGASAVPHL
jgi:hypothetical protein